MEGSSSYVLTPLVNYLLLGVIRCYVRSIDLEYRQLFIKGESRVEYFLRISKMTPTVFNAKKYTSDREISKLLTLSLFRMNVRLSFGTKYVRVKINLLTKIPSFLMYAFSFESV